MKTRKEFPLLLNSLGLVGEGAEIGVFRGDFSAHILAHWKGERLYSVDAWKHQGKFLDVSDVAQEEHNENMRACMTKLQPFKTRSVVVSALSVVAASSFPENDAARLDFVYIDAAHDYAARLDFVYIDAAHDYRSVWEDLVAWFPRVKRGGILAGHDYKNSFVRKNLVEVKRAVDNFFRMQELTINTTTDDNLPSWFVIKK